MYGDGIRDLKDAMEYIFSEKAASNLIQFTELDKIDVIAFGNKVNKPWSAMGNNTKYLLEEINNYSLDGATSLYPAAEKAIELLQNESSEYNTSVILMTDGEGNIGTFNNLEKVYKNANKEIPIYSITFGSASYDQLNKMAMLSNGKVFDGKSGLKQAFAEVRSYN